MIALPRLPLSVWLGAALAVSVGLNLWQLYRSGGASARCETAQAKAGTAVLEEAAERDTEALEVAEESAAEAETAVAEVQADSNERKETIHVVYRDLPPVDPVCPVALPERVRDTLGEGVAAANRADL